MRPFPAAVLICAVSGLAFAQTYSIQTFAGGGSPGNAAGALTGAPFSVAVDASGHVFFSIADQNVVMRLDPSTGTVQAVAGTGTAGAGGDGGPAVSAQLNYPLGLAVDAAGDLYIADARNAGIRKVSSAGIISTVAGNGAPGVASPGGFSLAYPTGIALDATGDLYIVDFDESRVFEVAGGVMMLVAGNGSMGFRGDGGPAANAELNSPWGVAVDAAGNVYITDYQNSRVREVSGGVITTVAGGGNLSGGSGIPATSELLSDPTGIAVDAAGNFYVAETGDTAIHKVSPAGIITTVAGDETIGFGGDGGPATSAMLGTVWGVAVDNSGNLYIADTGNMRIREVSNGIIDTIVGSGAAGGGDNGPAVSASLAQPASTAVDAAGNVYIAESGANRVRKVSPAGVITTVAGTGTRGSTGDGGPAVNAQVCAPSGVAVDSASNLYIADACYRVRKVSTGGIISTIAGTGSAGFSGDGGPATGAQVEAQKIATDRAGNLYLDDEPNERIRMVTPGGIITTVAGNGAPGYTGDGGPATSAELQWPADVAVDAAGNLYIADMRNGAIREVSGGIITTVAGIGAIGFVGDGGPASSAVLNYPAGLAVNRFGSLYVSDTGNARIREISAGAINTVAGNGTAGFGGDGGLATSAELNGPLGLAVDSAGNVYIADYYNNRVRILKPTGTSCSYAVSYLISAPAYGGNIQEQVQTTPACSWAATVPAGWVALSGSASGTGTGYVTLVVAANIGPPRSETLNIAGVAVTVNQQGLTACATGLSAISQDFGPEGGAGTVTLTASANCPWTATDAPDWVTITAGQSGSGTGQVSYSVSQNSFPDRSGTILIGGAAFTVTQAGALPAGSVLAGSMPQIAFGAGWETTLTLVNASSFPSWAELEFTDDSAAPLTLPFTFPPGPSGNFLASALEETLAPYSVLTLDASSSAGAGAEGLARLFTLGSDVGAFAIFSYAPTGQQAAVPLQSQSAPAYFLPFDNTGAIATGVAIANLGGVADPPYVVRDSSGNRIAAGVLPLATGAHTSFMLADQMPVVGARGTVEFDTPPGGQIGLLGLRVNGGALTSVPVSSSLQATAGSLAQVVSGGGWQTTFTLVNGGTSTTQAQLDFYDDSGKPLWLPVLYVESGQAMTASSLAPALPPGASLTIETQGSASAPVAEGWAQIDATGGIGAFAIVSNSQTGQEAAVPLETRNASGYVLPYDNTGGVTTGVAIANLTPNAVIVSCIAWGDTESQDVSTGITLGPYAHTSFILGSQTALPWTNGGRGFVEFTTQSPGTIGVVGLRATPSGAYTTIPVFPSTQY